MGVDSVGLEGVKEKSFLSLFLRTYIYTRTRDRILEIFLVKKRQKNVQ